MARLSDLRLDVHTTYSVKPDGTEGEQLSQSLRYTNPVEGKAYSSVEEALSEVDSAELATEPAEEAQEEQQQEQASDEQEVASEENEAEAPEAQE